MTDSTRLLENVSLFLNRHKGLLVAAAGVGAAFIVMIGTGYRVTNTAGSPIGDLVYFASIGVLALVVAVAVRSYWPAARPDTPVIPVVGEAPAVDAPQPMESALGPYEHLHERLLPLARTIDAPAHLLPTYRISEGNGLPHIEIDGDTYHYVHAERGSEFDRFSTTSLDELLYRIFRDVAFSMSTGLARPHRKPGEDFRREMFPRQLALLARLNPQWAERCSAEHREVLAKHPFVDEA